MTLSVSYSICEPDFLGAWNGFLNVIATVLFFYHVTYYTLLLKLVWWLIRGMHIAQYSSFADVEVNTVVGSSVWCSGGGLDAIFVLHAFSTGHFCLMVLHMIPV